MCVLILRYIIHFISQITLTKGTIYLDLDEIYKYIFTVCRCFKP